MQICIGFVCFFIDTSPARVKLNDTLETSPTQKFKLENTIVEILSRKNDETLSIKKLQKKVS